jgi:hypothetical protein
MHVSYTRGSAQHSLQTRGRTPQEFGCHERHGKSFDNSLRSKRAGRIDDSHEYSCLASGIDTCMYACVCVCVCVCVCATSTNTAAVLQVCICVCMHVLWKTAVFTYMYMHANVHGKPVYMQKSFMSIHIFIWNTYIRNIRTLKHTFIHTCMHTYINIYIHIHTHIHTYIHRYNHTYTHTYIHTYINVYTHT